MALTVKENGGSRVAPMEAGTYPARCVGVIDLGVQYNEKWDKRQEKLRLIFEFPTERMELDGGDKPRWLSKKYTASLNEKAELYRDLCAWRGVPFTPEELNGFDMRKLLGAPCMVCVVNHERNGNTYTDITAISRAMKGMEVPPLENEALLFDMDGDVEEAKAVFEKLPQWMRDEVARSDTWQALWKEGAAGGGFAEPEDGGGPLPF
ncbi:MAG: hypothetical protein HFF09_06675 [Oscillospiraceae bacterium]|nr:hypothetical protein [Oscillospiraceae bacterium]